MLPSRSDRQLPADEGSIWYLKNDVVHSRACT